ncbi:MAG: DHA2 family efflux MFS transporter permease subunit [Steroidobacteraceae bacterium]
MVAPTGSRWLLGAVTMLATLLYTIDTTIVNVALPHMQGSLQATQDQIAWVVTSYIVVSAIATPLAGWLGTRLGLRRVLSVAIIGFTLSSALCGIATDIAQMVGCRMLQGAFGAALVPLSQVVLMRSFPAASQGRVMAWWGTGIMVGPVIGPTLGGWLTDTLSWRWAFLVNVPVGFIAWAGLLASMQRDDPEGQRPFDATGFVLLSLALGLFQLMLDRGETKAWFESGEIVAYAFFAALAIYMFTVHALTDRHPFVDIHLFRDRNFSVSLAIMFVIGLAVIAPSVLLPGFLQQLQGYTPTQAGEMMAARGAASIVAMQIVTRLGARIGARATMCIGVVTAATSLFMMGRFSIDTPAHTVVWAAALQGLGVPLIFMPLLVVGFATLPRRAQTEAGSLMTLLRNVGSSIGVSATVALLARSAQANQAHLVEHFTAYDTARWQAAGAVPGADAATGALVGEIARQAAGIAYANDFVLLGATTLLTLPFVFLLRGQRS